MRQFLSNSHKPFRPNGALPYQPRAKRIGITGVFFEEVSVFAPKGPKHISPGQSAAT